MSNQPVFDLRSDTVTRPSRAMREAMANAGVQFAQAGAGGMFDADELSAVVKPRADYHPRTSLVCLENTHNRAGGRIFPQTTLEAVVERARGHGLGAHLDGARLWHAAQ